MDATQPRRTPLPTMRGQQPLPPSEPQQPQQTRVFFDSQSIYAAMNVEETEELQRIDQGTASEKLFRCLCLVTTVVLKQENEDPRQLYAPTNTTEPQLAPLPDPDRLTLTLSGGPRFTQAPRELEDDKHSSSASPSQRQIIPRPAPGPGHTSPARENSEITESTINTPPIVRPRCRAPFPRILPESEKDDGENTTNNTGRPPLPRASPQTPTPGPRMLESPGTPQTPQATGARVAKLTQHRKKRDSGGNGQTRGSRDTTRNENTLASKIEAEGIMNPEGACKRCKNNPNGCIKSPTSSRCSHCVRSKGSCIQPGKTGEGSTGKTANKQQRHQGSQKPAQPNSNLSFSAPQANASPHHTATELPVTPQRQGSSHEHELSNQRDPPLGPQP